MASSLLNCANDRKYRLEATLASNPIRFGNVSALHWRSAPVLVFSGTAFIRHCSHTFALFFFMFGRYICVLFGVDILSRRHVEAERPVIATLRSNA